MFYVFYHMTFVLLGTLGADIEMLVRKFLTGMKYMAKPHDVLKSYGTIDVAFGTVIFCYIKILYFYK